MITNSQLETTHRLTTRNHDNSILEIVVFVILSPFHDNLSRERRALEVDFGLGARSLVLESLDVFCCGSNIRFSAR